MRRRSWIFASTLLILVPVLLAGCHGSGSNTYTVKWVNQTDTSQVLELKLPGRSVLGKVHQVVFGTRLKGNYVLKNGTTTSEGNVTQDNGEFILVSNDGKKQRFRMEKPTSLKDEGGAIWNREDPPTTAVLREW